MQSSPAVPADWTHRLAAALEPLDRPQAVRGFVSASRSRRPLSPRLAYGRHRGPARVRARRAAVLIAIFPHRRTGELCLVLTRRPLSLSHHGGQVCLPGGRIEAGESPLQAALREYREELGVQLRAVKSLGRLAPMYVFASDNWVETLVVATDTPGRPWQPDPAEVDQVIEMPVAVLSKLHHEMAARRRAVTTASGVEDAAMVRRRYAKRTVRGPRGDTDVGYRFGYPEVLFVDCRGNHWTLWGATAMLLAEFADAWNRVAWRDRLTAPVGVRILACRRCARLRFW